MDCLTGSVWIGTPPLDQRIDVLDAVTNALPDTRNVTGFSNGQYLLWNISGHVKLRITNTGLTNAVVSGLFFQPTAGPTP
jgi:hypothetical protein